MYNGKISHKGTVIGVKHNIISPEIIKKTDNNLFNLKLYLYHAEKIKISHLIAIDGIGIKILESSLRGNILSIDFLMSQNNISFSIIKNLQPNAKINISPPNKEIDKEIEKTCFIYNRLNPNCKKKNDKSDYLLISNKFDQGFWGNIDCTGVISNNCEQEIEIEVPPIYQNYIQKKDRIFLNGVEFCVYAHRNERFIAKYTEEYQKNSSLSEMEKGNAVNIEFDPIAKYLRRLENIMMDY